MKRLSSILLVCLPLTAVAARIASPGGVRGQETPAPAREELPSGRSAGSQEVASLAWMSGTWTSNALGGRVEETWMAPLGESMTGMLRLMQKDQVSFHQFMVIEQRDGGVWLSLQHFNAGLTPWEKEGPLRFQARSIEAGKAVFESPDPKQTPSRLTYSAIGERGMSVKIESPQALGGPMSFDALYERPNPAR